MRELYLNVYRSSDKDESDVVYLSVLCERVL